MSNKPKRQRKTKIDRDILLQSRRRCCLCFGLNNDLAEKKGQIAHLDGDSSNNKTDNLAFMCFDHHDQYDSTTSQSKSLQIGEVKSYRDKLYQHFKDEVDEIAGKNKSGEPFSKSALNAYLTEKPHKCCYCGYSFSIMPDLEEGKAYFIKTATCPKCSNVDEVNRFYKG